MSDVAQRSRIARGNVRDALAAIRVLCPSPVPLTEAVHDAGVALATEHGFTIYDALIVAAALQAGCETCYSEDLQAGQLVAGRLTIRNPFAT